MCAILSTRPTTNAIPHTTFIGKTATIPSRVGDEWRTIVIPQTVAAGTTLFSITPWENDLVSHDATAKEYVVINSTKDHLKDRKVAQATIQSSSRYLYHRHSQPSHLRLVCHDLLHLSAAQPSPRRRQLATRANARWRQRSFQSQPSDGLSALESLTVPFTK